MIAPGSWLGLLGGGQLGRMFTMAAQSMGYKVMVLDPGELSPAGSVADEHLRAGYLDREALRKMASRCEAATTEFEHRAPGPERDGLAGPRIAVTPFAFNHFFASSNSAFATAWSSTHSKNPKKPIFSPCSLL